MPRVLLEVAVSSVECALAAEAAGADRLEVSQALALGGLTPSAGLLRGVRRATRLPLMALIRPREGGFIFTEAELRVMEDDVEFALDNGADGVVIGALTPEGDVSPWIGRFTAGGREVVFHRAFDEVRDPLASLEALRRMGVRRVLTSGQAASAVEGAGLLARLIAAGGVEVLPGAGVNAGNVAELVRRTGCTQVHGTFRGDAGEMRRVRAALGD